jgi:hypothetical protein
MNFIKAVILCVTVLAAVPACAGQAGRHHMQILRDKVKLTGMSWPRTWI